MFKVNFQVEIVYNVVNNVANIFKYITRQKAGK
jgi:hypothetical protein